MYASLFNRCSRCFLKCSVLFQDLPWLCKDCPMRNMCSCLLIWVNELFMTFHCCQPMCQRCNWMLNDLHLLLNALVICVTSVFMTLQGACMKFHACTWVVHCRSQIVNDAQGSLQVFVLFVPTYWPNGCDCLYNVFRWPFNGVRWCFICCLRVVKIVWGWLVCLTTCTRVRWLSSDCSGICFSAMTIQRSPRCQSDLCNVFNNWSLLVHNLVICLNVVLRNYLWSLTTWQDFLT